MIYKIYKCQLCGEEHSARAMTPHLLNKHNMTVKEYYDKYIDPKPHICANENCNNEAQFMSISVGYSKCCCQTCANSYSTKNRHETEPIFGLKKAQSTNLKVYGNVCSLHGKGPKKKKIKTWKKNYGTTHPMKNKKVRNKAFNTAMSNANCKTPEEYYRHIQSEIQEDLKKYGYNEDGTQKITNVFQLESTKNKIKETKLELHGDENYSNHTKAMETLMNTYGQIFNNPKYRYKELSFDSSWELAYYIWLEDHNVNFTFHKDKLNYYWSGDNKIHTYYPDFNVEGKLVEIKNNHLLEKMKIPGTQENAKYNLMLENEVELITNDTIQPYLDYINNKYSKHYLESFKVVKNG